ncbi:MAG: hypothetical protein A4E27_00549 [Methanobacterium sp. PtaU1.Bin242]|nr:MAG: hypothetical protein A4E27_00549 [Methanobacterium sp. PtaU1.Bin242]
MKPITNKTIYNPYAKEKVFHKAHQVSPEDQENMKEYQEKTHKKRAPEKLPLKCSNCNLSITIQPTTKDDTFLIERYGQLDPVLGRVYEFDCPLCIGVMEKIRP